MPAARRPLTVFLVSFVLVVAGALASRALGESSYEATAPVQLVRGSSALTLPLLSNDLDAITVRTAMSGWLALHPVPGISARAPLDGLEVHGDPVTGRARLILSGDNAELERRLVARAAEAFVAARTSLDRHSYAAALAALHNRRLGPTVVTGPAGPEAERLTGALLGPAGQVADVTVHRASWLSRAEPVLPAALVGAFVWATLITALYLGRSGPRAGGLRRLIGIAVVALAVALGAPGCSLKPRAAATVALPGSYPPVAVDARTVAQTRPRSVARTVVRWWQAMQHEAADTAYALHAPSFRAALVRPAFALRLTAVSDRFLASWFIARQRVTGRRANVLLIVVFAGRAAGRYVASNSSAVAVPLHLERVRGRWLLADDPFVTAPSLADLAARPLR